MFKTKFEDNEVNIAMKKEIVEQLTKSGINYVEVFRLIESFAQKMLVPGQDSELRLENDDTRAAIDIDVKWDLKAKKVQMDIISVDLNNMGPRDTPKMPKGAKVDLGQSIDSMEDQIPAN